MRLFFFLFSFTKLLHEWRLGDYNMSTSGRKWEKVGNMFFGSYEHTIDEKGRLVIPRKMRDELGGKLFIMKGFDGALSLQKEEVFQALLEQFQTLPFNIKNNRDYLRPQLASACELEMDKMGRVQIPTLLLTKYKIGKDVVIIGAGDHIEVWDKQTYMAYEEEAEANFETLAETISQKE